MSVPALRQNSKSEIRNPKQSRNPKSQTPEAVSRCGAFLVFELRICFGFRASDFEFGRKPGGVGGRVPGAIAPGYGLPLLRSSAGAGSTGLAAEPRTAL